MTDEDRWNYYVDIDFTETESPIIAGRFFDSEKIVCMYTYWTLFSMNLDVWEARSLTGVPILVQRWYGLFSLRYPGLLVICVQKEKKKRLYQTLVPSYVQEALQF